MRLTHRPPCVNGDHCGEAAHCPPVETASDLDAQTLAEIHAQAGHARRGGPSMACAWPGCTRSAESGDVLVRVNPKGEPGIFMCRDDARAYAAEVSR